MKVIRIESCEECPYYYWQQYYQEHVCTKIGCYTILDGKNFHPDCPLLDAQRCEWTGNNYKGFIKGCSGGYIYRMEPDYCEDCGRRVKIKEDTNV